MIHLFPFFVRIRAARLDNYVETLTGIHKSFDLPYPAVNQLSSAPLSPKPWVRHGENKHFLRGGGALGYLFPSLPPPRFWSEDVNICNNKLSWYAPEFQIPLSPPPV